MFKAISSILLAALLICFPSYAHTAEAKSDGSYPYTAEVKSEGNHPYKAVRLTPEIYRGANADLSDLRIRDSEGKDIPYFIHSGGQSSSEESESYKMELQNAYMQEDAFYFDYKLMELPDGDVPATSLVLETGDRNFAKEITLFGSYDNQHWEKVQDDILYNVGGKKKDEIFFTTPLKYTHYRVKLSNNLEKISFGLVTLKYNMTDTQEYYFRETLKPQFTVEEKEKETFIHIEGLTKLRLCDVTIETDSMFKRFVSAPFGSRKELYNLSFDHTSYKDTTIPLGERYLSEEDFTLRISNYDDVPIKIKDITVSYCADEVVFAAGENKSVTLFFGDAAAVSPVYDIETYKNEILRGEVDRLSMGEVAYAKQVEPEMVKEPDYALIFNIVIIMTAVFLGVIILMRMRKKGE